MSRSKRIPWHQGVIVLGCFLAGCSFLKQPFDLTIQNVNYDPPQLPARIQLSDPQVFARETLVNDRYREREHIAALITNSVNEKFEPQLQRDLTTISALAAQLGIGFNPAIGAQNSQLLERQTAQHAVDLARLEVELQGLRNKLDTLEEGNTLEQNVSTNNANSDQLGQISPGDVDKITGRLDKIVERAERLLQLDKLTRKSGVSVSPEDKYRDLQAYRAELRADEAAVDLDDVHDQEGNTLYRIQLRATLLPGKIRDKFGISMVDVVPPMLNEYELTKLYYRWLMHANRRLNRKKEGDIINYDFHYVRLGQATDLFSILKIPISGHHQKIRMALHPDAHKFFSNRICNTFFHKLLQEHEDNSNETNFIDTKTQSDAYLDKYYFPDFCGELSTFKGQVLLPYIPGTFGGYIDDIFKTAEESQTQSTQEPPQKLGDVIEKSFFGSQMGIRTDRHESKATVSRKHPDGKGISQMLSNADNETLDQDPASINGGTDQDNTPHQGHVDSVSTDSIDPQKILYEKCAKGLLQEINQKKMLVTADVTKALGKLIRMASEILGTASSIEAAIIAMQDVLKVQHHDVANWLIKKVFVGYDDDLFAARKFVQELHDSSLNLEETRCKDEIFLPPLEFMKNQRPPPASFVRFVGATKPILKDKSLLRTLKGESYTYAAAPVQKVQRLSTVSSAANAIEMAVALSAVLPAQGLNIQGGLGKMQTAVGKIDALERAPLVIGFSDRVNYLASGREWQQSRFGWVFGPPIRVDTEKQELVLQHGVASHQVTADISVPGWWPHITLKARSAWIGNWNDTTPANKHKAMNDRHMQWNQEIPLSEDCEQQAPNYICESIKIRLAKSPEDFEQLTNFLASEVLHQRLREPRIDFVEPQTVSVCAGKVAFQVFGVDLWRGGEAYLEGRKATDYTVLPSMAGVAVNFDVSKFKKLKPGDKNARLMIWTRSGPVSTKVTINQENCAQAAPPIPKPTALAFSSKNLVFVNDPGTSLNLAVKQGALPIDYQSIKVITLVTADERAKCTARGQVLGGRRGLKTDVLSFPACGDSKDAKEAMLSNGSEIEIAVRIIPAIESPSKEIIEATVKPNLIYFKKEEDAQVKIVDQLVSINHDDSFVVKFSLPVGVEKAFPQFKAGATLQAHVDLQQTAGKKIALKTLGALRWPNDKQEFLEATLTAPDADTPRATFKELLSTDPGAKIQFEFFPKELSGDPMPQVKSVLVLKQK